MSASHIKRSGIHKSQNAHVPNKRIVTTNKMSQKTAPAIFPRIGIFIMKSFNTLQELRFSDNFKSRNEDAKKIPFTNTIFLNA